MRGAHKCGQVLPSDGCFDVESLQAEHVLGQYLSASTNSDSNQRCWFFFCSYLRNETARSIFAILNGQAWQVFENQKNSFMGGKVLRWGTNCMCVRQTGKTDGGAAERATA